MQERNEVEFVLEGQDSSLISFKHCTKNPGHKDFVKFTDFKVENLPSDYQDVMIYKMIQYIGLITVKLNVSFTSNNRSNNDETAKFRGTTNIRLGSGFIMSVCKKEKSLGKKCPCKECLESNNPKEQWAEILVLTAKHVVFDTEEVKHTKCELFYDVVRQIEILYGLKVHKVIDKNDACIFLCAMHNLETWNKIKMLCDMRDNIHRKLADKYTSKGLKNQLAIIVSHPHGQPKMVSVGDVISFKRSLDGDVQYEYRASTCSGSSGAPVYVLSREWDLNFSEHVHSSSTLRNGINRSSFGPA
ncbi:uncharacterized protein LOC106053186 [Biomphalaria glabrata]|uniref:Uncharacterized protein LOC106053186 n=1 Tax=Biomphalaria glabrata TaxID=6526 RepID=A0A9U8DX41_BIOGL|nr:uncharacterized protein LOC106053186 [Biomphalaria glabrata]